MKIQKIVIKGFGKLKDYTAEPSKGFNLVFGLNESGKSTLQAFIKAALYGMTDREKEKYRPWFSDVYAGSLVYSLDSGAVYNLNRDFTNDIFSLENDKGEVISDSDAVIEKQLGVDRETFCASAYMEQARIRFDAGTKDTLKRKLSEMYMSEFTDVTVAETLDLLSKYRQSNEILGIDEEIRNVQLALEAGEEAEIGKTPEDLSQQVKRFNLIRRNHEELQHELSEKTRLKSFMDKTDEKTKAVVYDKKDIQKMINLKNRHITVASDKSVLPVIFFIICIGAIGLGVYSFVSSRNDLFMIALGVLGFSFLILLIEGLVVLLKSRKLKNLQKQISELAAKNSLPSDIGMNELMKIEPEPAFVPMDIETIREKLEKCEETISLKFAAIKLNADRDINSIGQIPEYISDLEKRIKKMTGGPKEENGSERYEQLASRLASLEEKKKEMVKTQKLFDITINTVKNAGKVGGQDYSVYFRDELARMMKAVTSGRYETIDSEGLDASILSPETGSYLGVEDLSTGTVEQFYLAARLAALFVLSKNSEKIPVFMDEIFAYSDEKRIIESFRFLDAEKNDHQIFYFTCRRTEASMVKTIVGDDLNILRLKV